MAIIIQLRRDTAANWTTINPILAQGEAGYETDTDKLKYGDGATLWSALSYWTGGAGAGSSFADNAFEIYDSGDATKKVVVEASAITTGTSRVINMPDVDVTLATPTELTKLANIEALADVTDATNVASSTTLTGEVTSTGFSTALSALAISNKTLVTAAATDMILIWDATDSTLKRVDASDFLGGGGGQVDSVVSGTRITVDATDPVNPIVNIDSTTDTDITTNNAKVTNVDTNLSLGTITSTTMDVNSSDGTNATLISATATDSGLMPSAKFNEVVTNNAKVTNATHTSEVTGSGALTIDPTAISNKTLITPVATDMLMVWDATDSALKKADASNFLGGGGSLAIGDTITSSTQGSILFVDNTDELQQDNALLFFDPTTKSIGLGTTTPSSTIPNGATASSGSYIEIISATTNSGLLLRNAAGSAGLDVWWKSNNTGIFFDSRFSANSGNAMTFRYGTGGTAVEFFKLDFVQKEIRNFFNAVMYKRLLEKQAANVASASTLTIVDGNSLEVTGTTNVDYITTTKWQDGSVVTLFFSDVLDVNHNAVTGPANTENILLSGSSNLTTANGTNLTLRLSTVNGVRAWRETSRTII